VSTLSIGLGDELPTLKPHEFEKFSKLAYDHFGLDLRNGKQSLVAARLGKKLRELGLKSFQDYYDYVTSDKSGAAMTGMVDFLTTNHTSFFREPRHFDFLRKNILPTVLKRPQINIWSAACSSGEEPYSIAMSVLEEAPVEARSKIRIRATDISTRVLERGRRGIYKAAAVEAIPMPLRQRFMLKGQNASSDCYRFKGEIRSLIDFEHLNLMSDFSGAYRCPVIFCRNIMIYFDKPTQENLVRRLSAQLEDGGYLFIGHSESLNGISHGLEYISPATYRKPLSGRGGQTGRN